ncbi:CU044_5270 family protein [Amycolatopsis carbonis]|uniref:CU044_5270 family protein n=1 Tax=Amycolatopsis carbonis TaxID=715471 RepID=A0A9Y2MVH8_9PSEU|nr:CU044_5270 family protein [Amycolatopsis sp. 2-15]WIX82915.1 CU044_5270 family protein [Amycolatopsis sp. 2-15]
MDEVEMIKAGRPPRQLPDDATLTAARAQLITVATQESRGRRNPKPSRYWVLTGTLATAAAAAVVVGVVFAPSPAGREPVPSAASPAAVSPGVVRAVDVVKILNTAAQRALALPNVPPRPDQYVYTQYTDGRQVWRSVDGGHTGLVQRSDGSRDVTPGCSDGQASAVDKAGQEVPGTTTPCSAEGAAYKPGLPTDPAALLTYLNGNVPYSADRPGDVNRVAKGTMELFDTTYLTPATRAALFKTIATLPGLHLDTTASDSLGRQGIGISWTYGSTNQLVFDPSTYTFLGVTTSADNGTEGASSVARVAIVDQAGQTPSN